jgi:hypothetical protein
VMTILWLVEVTEDLSAVGTDSVLDAGQLESYLNVSIRPFSRNPFI